MSEGDRLPAIRQCLVGSGLDRCQLDEGHSGMHHATVGAGSVSWSRPSPEWVQPGRYAYPGEPEYDTALERLRVICAR
jgi:hypothetical protein